VSFRLVSDKPECQCMPHRVGSPRRSRAPMEHHDAVTLVAIRSGQTRGSRNGVRGWAGETSSVRPGVVASGTGLMVVDLQIGRARPATSAHAG
jgi:hypothetical protein